VRFLRFVVPGLVTSSIALLGADIGHSVIPLLSRWGVAPFGSYAHAGVIPALLAGILLIGVAVLIIFGDALAKATGLGTDWFTGSARVIAHVSWFRFLFAIFALQIATLLVMEFAEQTIAFGHPLGAAGALGAPVFVALAAQALSALAVGAAVLFGARSVVAAIVTFARAIRPAFRRQRWSADQPAAALQRAQNFDSFVPVLAPLARHVANRPPPLAATAV
jgi:hypothetical protein